MIPIVEIVSNFAIYLIKSFGYYGIFFAMTLESACIPIPSEVIMPFAGYVVNERQLSLIGVTLVGATGNLLGSLIAYYVGIKGGRPFLEKYGKYLHITESKIKFADRIFAKYGNETIFISRMLPIVRTFISLPAGIAEMDLKKFALYTFLGSLPWSFVLAFIGVKLGENWVTIRSYFHVLDIIVGVILLIIIGIFIFKKWKN